MVRTCARSGQRQTAKKSRERRRGGKRKNRKSEAEMGRQRETRPVEGHKWVTTAEETGTWKELTRRSEQTTQ